MTERKQGQAQPPEDLEQPIEKILENGWISFAKVGRPHGLSGAFFLKTEDRREKWDGYKNLYLEHGKTAVPVHVKNAYQSGGKLALEISAFNSREAVAAGYDKTLYVHRREINLKDDEYLVHDLVGMKVFCEGRGEIGKILSVSNYGAQENLEIDLLNGKGSILFPFIDAFVKKVDNEARTIEIMNVEAFIEGDSE
jgi:16S rRNA processing protein RimM